MDNLEVPKAKFLLDKARYFAGKRNFSRLSHFLTQYVPVFFDNAELFFYLGASHFYMENFELAEKFLKIGLQKDPEHIDIRLMSAIICLKNKKPNAALKLWLEVLDIDPANKKAKKGLNIIKVLNTVDNSRLFFQKNQLIIKKLEPDLPVSFVHSRRFSSFLVLSISIILTCFFLFFFKKSFSLFFLKPVTVNRDSINVVSELSKRDNLFLDTLLLKKKNNLLVNNNHHYYFEYSPKEILGIMNQIKKDFNEYRDNKLRFDLNKIKYSNASSEIKTKAALLRDSLIIPKFSTQNNNSTLDTNYSLKEVVSKPFLYEGVFVHWKGKIENIRVTPTAILCDFLVGYHNEQVLEGTVPIVIPFEVHLDPLLTTEILGEIYLLENKITLKATSVHPILIEDLDEQR